MLRPGIDQSDVVTQAVQVPADVTAHRSGADESQSRPHRPSPPARSRRRGYRVSAVQEGRPRPRVEGDADRAQRVGGQLGEPSPPPGDWAARIGGADHAVSLEEDAITVDGAPVALELEYAPGDRFVEVALYGEGEDEKPAATYGIQVEAHRTGYRLTTRGAKHDARVLPARIAHLGEHMLEKIPPDLSKLLICPMPGLLVKLHVAEGEEVQPGQPLATVEAMKMENILRAEKPATVGKINAAEGASLAVDEVILELE